MSRQRRSFYPSLQPNLSDIKLWCGLLWDPWINFQRVLCKPFDLTSLTTLTLQTVWQQLKTEPRKRDSEKNFGCQAVPGKHFFLRFCAKYSTFFHVLRSVSPRLEMTEFYIFKHLVLGLVAIWSPSLQVNAQKIHFSQKLVNVCVNEWIWLVYLIRSLKWLVILAWHRKCFIIHRWYTVSSLSVYVSGTYIP